MNNKLIFKHLQKDPVMKALISKHGELGFKEKKLTPETIFEDLVNAIISQQLSVKASDTIFKRFKKIYGDKKFPTAKEIINTPHEKLRGAGLSNAKAIYVKNLAQHIDSRQIDLINLQKMANEEVIIELTKVKGIGRWTAEMILIFTLHRSDVFSLGDLGLRRAMENLYEIKINDFKAIEKLSLKWLPYRSMASRYLWKSLDNI